MTTVAETYGLTATQLDALASELDALRAEVVGQLGTADVAYIRRVIRVQRWAEITGRASLFLGFLPPFWLLGAGALSLSKILDNMEIGHNVLHGQYDWTNDPALASDSFEWDSSCPAKGWQHYHNYLHHTFTNITDKDRDLGYGVIRISAETPWAPSNLGNPLYALGLALIFDHGIMLHDVDIAHVREGKKTWAEAKPSLVNGLKKSGKLAFRDYIMWPAFTGPLFLTTLAANALANVVRNVWAFIIIFCGHFPTGVLEFTEEECEGESKGHWYFRQMLGSGNISGGRLFHIMSGNLSFQIEHHIFPDIPARRYQQIAPQVREICQRYGIPYNTGRLSRQFGSVIGKIFRFALPGRKKQAKLAPPSEPQTEPTELLAA
ncbi:MAG TPA: acyl-CoA desaturase [Acidimicrobiales bacterium]|jgi:linoleoyl-CoA desaturase|nr:acyl-CoA desaturase [Acidimicrobiales bacterium]